MQTLAETTSRAMANLPTNPRDSGLPTNIAKQLSARSKQQLAELLSQICALQKAYGKTPAELETLVEGFSWALADYAMPKIIEAMRGYILSHSDIPAPADILKIIKDKEKPPAARPSLNDLQRYRSVGIPLTQDQIEELRLHEKTL